jgi:hypothetical protein
VFPGGPGKNRLRTKLSHPISSKLVAFYENV